jgi:hypothetical protein
MERQIGPHNSTFNQPKWTYIGYSALSPHTWEMKITHTSISIIEFWPFAICEAADGIETLAVIQRNHVRWRK